MLEVRVVTQIAAPPERVWDLMADLSGYPDWNPLLRPRHRPRPNHCCRDQHGLRLRLRREHEQRQGGLGPVITALESWVRL